MNKKLFSYFLAALLISALSVWFTIGGKTSKSYQETYSDQQQSLQPSDTSNLITLFLCGDVMTGRGIDQVLPHPNDPKLYQRKRKSAELYVSFAEKVNGPIHKPVHYSYIWGDALNELNRVRPDLRIINLETSVTDSNNYWKDEYGSPKRIQYRMHPENIPALTDAKIDFCSLANNHVLDWGYNGLKETLETLKNVNIKFAGAGQNLLEAETPAVMEVEGKGRAIVFSFGLPTSGIPLNWAASKEKPGVNILMDLSDRTIQRIKEKIEEVKQPGDIIIISIHWGRNWGHEIPSEQIELAHKLIDIAGVDVIHGHSSHHVKGLEVYKEKPIIYGAGDFINDYEGISRYEKYRHDLSLMYFVSLDPLTGNLASLRMTPMKIKHFKSNRASRKDAKVLKKILNKEGKQFGTRVEIHQDNTLTLRWD